MENDEKGVLVYWAALTWFTKVGSELHSSGIPMASKIVVLCFHCLGAGMRKLVKI